MLFPCDDKKYYDLTSYNGVFAFSFYKDTVSKFSLYEKAEYLKSDKTIPLSSGLEYTFKNYFSVACKPHSFLEVSHHHLPALASSSFSMALVQGAQPMLIKPLS